MATALPDSLSRNLCVLCTVAIERYKARRQEAKP